MSTQNQAQQPTQEYNEKGQKIWRHGTLTYTVGGLVLLFALLLGADLPWALRDRSVQPSMQVLFGIFKTTTWYYGVIAVTLPTVMGMVMGPIISYKSDRHRGRFGRRIPYLFFTTPLVVLGMLGMAGSTVAANFIYQYASHWSYNEVKLMTLSLSWLFFDVGAIAGGAVFMALVKDVVPTHFFGRFMSLFRIVGLLAGILFNYALIVKVETHYPYIFGGIGLLFGIAVFIMCIFVKEGEYPPPPEPPPVPEREGRFGALLTRLQKGHLGPLFVYAKESFASKYYWMVFVILITLGLMFGPVNSFVIFYAQALDESGAMSDTASFERVIRSVLAFFGQGGNTLLFDNVCAFMGVHEKGVGIFGKFTALSYLISLTLAYPLGWLADRYHPLRCSMVVLGLGLVTYAVTAPFISDKLTFTIAIVAHNTISGCLWTVSASLALRLFPQARFAQFGSACGLAGGIFVLIYFPLLSLFFDKLGKNYYYTFHVGFVLGLISLVVCFIFIPFFKKQGGYDNYVAPEL